MPENLTCQRPHQQAFDGLELRQAALPQSLRDDPFGQIIYPLEIARSRIAISPEDQSAG
jgi:hypothetical protein